MDKSLYQSSILFSDEWNRSNKSKQVPNFNIFGAFVMVIFNTVKTDTFIPHKWYFIGVNNKIHQKKIRGILERL